MQQTKRSELLHEIRELLTRKQIKGKVTILRALPNRKPQVISETETTCTRERIVIEIVN